MSDFTDNLDIEAHDIWVAFALLTRLPVPVDHDRAAERGAKAAWAYPIVGMALGAIAALIAGAAANIGATSDISAVIALAIIAILTGGMHEDGLADTADGMGVSGKDRKLAVMRDSHIGAFGVIALILILIGRWSGTEAVNSALLALIAVGATSRAAMVLQMYLLPNATETGLSASTGRPDAVSAIIAVALAAIACLAFIGLPGTIMVAVSLAAILPVTAYAKRALDGQTGDILGATQQFAEFAALAAAAAIIA